MQFFTGYIPAWLILNGDIAISLALAVLAIAGYILLRPGSQLQKALMVLGIAGVAARLALGLYFTLGQLVVWSSNELGRLFLPPNQSWWYFITYVGERYLLDAILALLLAALWYGFLKLVGSRSERYLDEGEIELTTIMVFAAGWPNALIMAPLAGALLIGYSLIRMALKRQYTTLGVPFMIATLITLAFANEIRALWGA